MRISVSHDSHGNITTLVVSTPDMPRVQMVQMGTQPPRLMTEVEAPPAEMTLETLDLDGPRLNETLSDLMQNYRVEIPSDKGRLVKKPDAAPE